MTKLPRGYWNLLLKINYNSTVVTSYIPFLVTHPSDIHEDME